MSLKHRVRFKGWKRLLGGLKRLKRDKRRMEKVMREIAKDAQAAADEEERGRGQG